MLQTPHPCYTNQMRDATDCTQHVAIIDRHNHRLLKQSHPRLPNPSIHTAAENAALQAASRRAQRRRQLRPPQQQRGVPPSACGRQAGRGSC